MYDNSNFIKSKMRKQKTPQLIRTVGNNAPPLEHRLIAKDILLNERAEELSSDQKEAIENLRAPKTNSKSETKLKHKNGLSNEQALVFDETLSTSKNVFVTGRAGTGKSYLLMKIINYLHEVTVSGQVAICAPTGIAAANIGGITIHKFFGIGIMEDGYEATRSRILNSPGTVERIKKIKYLIIDEISMIKREELRLINNILKILKDGSHPFGGTKVILFGDFYQLPPVDRYKNSLQWCFHEDAWSRGDIRTLELIEVRRTSETRFLSILENFRQGDFTADVLSFIKERTLSPPHGTPRLMPKRNEVFNYNCEKLKSLQGNATDFKTIFAGDDAYNSSTNFVSVDPVLTLKVGAVCITRINDPDGRFFNGSACEIVAIGKAQVKVKILKSNLEVVLLMHTFSILDENYTEVATYTNFPLMLAWALTIHKAQGLTLESAAISLAGARLHGQSYVALSRVRKSESIFITSFTTSSCIRPDLAVVEFMSKKKSAA